MAVSVPRSCGNHRPYKSKAEATAKASWHLTCAKCKAGLVLHVWVCLPDRQHFHIGHQRP